VNRPTDAREGGDGPVLAVVSDLFFVARIRETGRLAGVPVEFARTPEQIAASLGHDPRLVLIDLTAGYDYDRVFAALEGARPAVLGFTTHALARQTQAWHPRCARVVTKETLTQELPRLLKEGVTA
jgi:predicted methyltransferase